MVYQPAYYGRFRCLASACPDSCCQLWTVAVDEESAAKYRALPGALGDTLRRFLRQRDGELVLENRHGRCPMWRADGLCALQAQWGADALCRTCRDFPRLRHDYGEFTELGLEASCPEAARLILTQSPELPPVHECRDETLGFLLKARREAAELIGAYPLPKALALLLLHGCYVQNLLDGEAAAPFDPETAWERARQCAGAPDIPALLGFLQELEHLTPRWEDLLGRPQSAPWGSVHAAFARYLIGRHYLCAVSDGDVYGRVKFILISCLVVKTLGGDPVSTAQLYAKEIENDPDNLDAILCGAYESPALTDDKLLGGILYA